VLGLAFFLREKGSAGKTVYLIPKPLLKCATAHSDRLAKALPIRVTRYDTTTQVKNKIGLIWVKYGAKTDII
jgi:hypothetical protein